MGILSEMRRGRKSSRSEWSSFFHREDKEEPKREKPERDANSWGRSSLSNDKAVVRLLQALRSSAPGGWTDDRWAQTAALTGIRYVCIHRMGEQLMQAEFQVWKKDRKAPNGKRPITPDDPPEGSRMVKPYRLVELLERPNKDDSFGDICYAAGQQLGLTGMSLNWVVPSDIGTPMEIYPIATATAIPQPVINPQYPDGYYRIQPLYPYGPFSSYPTPNSAVGAAIPAQWMMRIKYQHPFLRYEGYSPLTAMRLSLDALQMVELSRHYSMRREFKPSAVLQMGDVEGMDALPEAEIERIRAELEAAFQGPENHGGLFVSAPGSTLEQWGNRPVDMDYNAGHDQLTSFNMAGFGITKPAAGMVEDSSYSTLFATMKQLHLLTLNPMCLRLSQRFTHFLGPFFGDDLIVEVRCPRIDDHEIKFSKLDKLMSGKAITKNELRMELEMPMTTEEWGEEIAGKEEGGEQPGMPGQEAPPQEEGKEAEPTKMETADADMEPADSEMETADGKPKEEDRVEPPQVTRSRPNPGTLSRGALGPRKGLLRKSTKSFYEKVKEYVANGH